MATLILKGATVELTRILGCLFAVEPFTIILYLFTGKSQFYSS